MKKLTFLFALLCASVMGWAGTKYCNYEMTAGGHTVYFSAYKVSEGNYQIKLTSTDAMDALSAGCYMNVNGVGGYQMLPHSTVSNDKKTITVDIAGTPGTIYNPLYIMMPGEVAFTAVQNVDIDWENTCEGGGDPEPGTGGGEEPEPDPNSYTAGGHTITLDASYVVDGSNKNYTLVITSTDDMDGLGGSFWNVNGVGTDMRTNMTVSGDKKTITCTATSTSNPNIYTPLYVMMPGEVNFGFVTLNWENRTPITSEYCNYQGPETHQDTHYYAITFETDASGNVVITIGDGTGAGACSFRNGGFEGDNNGLANFVVSDDNFATTTPAADYFTVTRPSDGDLQYVLTKIADLPANAKIKHLSAGAIAWREAGADRWCFPEFIYTYGGTCNQLDAPTNVSIDANNIITFDAVSGADSYTAYVSLSGVHKYSQVVASGDELTFVPLVDGAYDVTVVASGSGKTDSDPSAAFVWNLEAVEIVLGNSEYCERIMQTGTNTEAAFTWETDGSGNIVITISETLGGAADASHFRNNALALANFKVGTGQAAGSNYFSHPGTTTGNQLVLTATNAPAPGEKIYYHGTVEYATSKDGNAWPTLDFEWTYGTLCAGKSVSATPNNNTMGSAVVKQGDDEVTSVEEGTSVTFIATVADAELYRFINWTKGGVEVSTNATYETTITESTNLIANFDYIRNTYCQYAVTSNASAVTGKKLYLTLGSIGGGQYQIKFEGSAETPLTALNNANYTVNHVTTDIVDGERPMSGNDVPFTNARWSFDATGNGSAVMTFGIQDGYTWEDIYVWNHSIFFATAAGELGYSGFPDRYHIAWNEACVDNDAPIMGVVSVASATSSTAVINVAATDEHLDAYHVVDNANGINVIIPAAAQITLTGLTSGTTYNFSITGIDVTGNESSTPAEVEVVMGAAASAVPTEAAPIPTWPADQVKSIYSDTYAFAPASLNSYNEGWWIQPAMTEENLNGDHYLRYHTNMNGMVGWQFGQISVVLMEKVHVDIWPSTDGTITMGPTSTNGTNNYVAGVTLTVIGGQWNSFDIPITDLIAANANFDPSTLFQNQFTGYSAQTTFSVDNVFFYRTTPLPADVAAPTNVVASVIETGFTSVKISVQADDDSGIVHFKVMNGSAELVSDVEAVSGVATTITISGLTPKTAYNLRVIAFDEAGHEAAPVVVPVTTQMLPPAAPQPTTTGVTVLSIYSDAFAPAVATSFRKTNWGSAPVALEADYLLYNMSSNVIVWGNNDGNAGYGNIDGLSGHTYGANTGLDVSGMNYIHFDVWCDADNQLNTININDGGIAIPTTRTVAGEWVSFDVDITGVALADRQNVRWLKFHPFNATNCNAAIDNVYFWSYGVATTTDNGGETGGWATFACSQKIQLPEGISAYKAVYSQNGNDEILTLSKLEDGIIPANEGVILHGTAGETFAFTPTDATPTTDMTDNQLVGCAVRTDVSAYAATHDIFCMRYSELFSMTGFFLYTGQYIPAGKAYLKLSKDGGAAPASRRIRFVMNNTDTATAIDANTVDANAIKFIENDQLFIRRGDAIYTIQGVRVK